MGPLNLASASCPSEREWPRQKFVSRKHSTGASQSCQRAERTKKGDCSKVTPGIQVLSRVEAVIIDPPNHISISPEACGLDSCDLICYLLPNIERFTSTYVSCLELIVSVHWHVTPRFFDKCGYVTKCWCAMFGPQKLGNARIGNFSY